MYTVAITGGIAMGKSTVSAYLCGAFPQQRFFDADATVSTLLTRPEICAKIAHEFGESVLTADGQIDRPYLREQVFDSVDRRAVLESILHPEVRNEFYNACLSGDESLSGEGALSGEGFSASLLIADIPLLFESANDYGVESVLVVASDSVTQMSRLLDRPGIDRETGRQMVAAQLPIEQKMARADHVIWNAGSRRILEKQTKQFASWLRKKIQNPKS